MHMGLPYCLLLDVPNVKSPPT